MMVKKIEQHVHLEGTIAPELALELAGRHGVVFPDGFIKDGRYQWRGFDEFLSAYDLVAACVKSAKDYEDVIYDYLVRAAAQDVILVEMGYSPFHCKVNAGLEHGEAIEALVRGIKRAKAKTKIEARLLCTAVRYLGELDAVMIAEGMAQYLLDNPSKYVTGFGLAGWEREDDVFAFTRAFEIAHEADLGLTAHAGENCGPVSVWNAIKAIPYLSRIGHGVRAIEDPALLEEIAQRGIVLEVCPSSNIVLEIFDGAPSMDQHPLPKLLESGVRCTINSDDPPFFFTDIEREYEIARDVFGFDESMLRDISSDALVSSFVQDEVKGRLMEKHFSG